MRRQTLALCAAFIFATAALAQPGSLDLSFNLTTPGLGDLTNNKNQVNTTAIQPDGKILIAGYFTKENGAIPTFLSPIFRLNTDGSLDETFKPADASLNINSIAIQPDGKIIIVGNFHAPSGTGIESGLMRLNADGSLDASFNQLINPVTGFQSVKIDANGKIIASTSYTKDILKINTDGFLDPTLNTGTGLGGLPDPIAYALVLQNDGKIIIGGNFTSYNGVPRNRIARLNEDGSLDETFNPGAGANGDVYTATLQADGKIIIGGIFTSYNGIPRNSIARLNPDGSLDATFNPGAGVNGGVRTTSIQANGKIIIGGGFRFYNGMARNNIARLNPDGSLDEIFNPGTGTNSLVLTTSIQADGKIIIGGSFTSYNGVARNRVARINGDEIIGGPLPVTLLSFTANKIKNAVLLQWQTAGEQNTSKFIIEKSTDGNSFEAIGNVAAKNTAGNHNYEFTDAAAWTGNTQYYRLKMLDTDGRFTYSNIVRVANNSTGTVAVYPNPASDIVVIQQNNNSKLLTKARLLDISGKTIQNISIRSPHQQISLKHLSAGVYMIQFEDGSNVKVVKR